MRDHVVGDNTMNTIIENTGPCRKKLTITVPSEQVKKTYDETMKAYAGAASIPGFRKGRAPIAVIKKKYGKDVEQDVKDHLTPEAYHEAVQKENVDAVNILNLEDAVLNPDQDYTFTVIVDVPPEFSLPKYMGLSLKSERVDVKEEDVQKARQTVLEQYASYEPVTDRPVQGGDVVQIDYRGTLDGQPLVDDPAAKPVAEATDFWVVAEEAAFLPGFSQELEGMNIGDEKTFTLKLGKDFHIRSLAGKKPEYQVTVKAVREKKMPELNDEILKALQVSSEEEFMKKLEENLKQSAEDRENRRLKDDICETLISKTKMDLPESVVQMETQNVVEDVVQQHSRQGLSKDHIESQRDSIMEMAGKSARERVKLRYLLHKIAQEEKIASSEDDLNQYLVTNSAYYGLPPEAFRKNLEERKALDNVRENLTLNKTLDFLLEKAQIKVK